MQFNVSQLLKEGAGALRQHTLHENIERLDPDITPLSTLDGTIQMIRTPTGVYVRGNLHCSAELVCARCLDPFSMPLHIPLDEEFQSIVDIATGATLPVEPDDELATQIDDRHTLDLTEVLRQDILLALPPFPICRTNCAGLCPACGKNQNIEKCNHPEEKIDPRLQVLEQLLKE
ncbi:MAG: DUF177 domain-containing protein [Chloroflexi bacterium]|nr:DUF177 domain-containing protein [Chloroflexota bacterium]